MEVGTFGTITSDQVISSAKMQLGIEVSDSDLFFDRLVNEGVRHLDSLSIFVHKECQLKVTDYKAKLPNGFHNLIALRVSVNNSYTNITYVDMPFMQMYGCGVNGPQIYPYVNTCQIQNGYIVFHGGVIAPSGYLTSDGKQIADPGMKVLQPIDYVHIAYWGLNIDKYGYLIIRDDYERALVAYCCWKYCQQNFEKYPNNLCNDYKMEWMAQKKWIKSNDVSEDFRLRKREMASVMNAIIKAKTWNI